MARPRVRPIIEVPCAFCGKLLIRSRDMRKPNHNYFCNMNHRNLFKIGKPAFIKWSNKKLIDEYVRLFRLVGHYPTYQDMKKLSPIYVSIFQKRFGTLDNLAKIAFPEFDPNHIEWSLNEVSAEDGGWLAGICAGESCFRIARAERLNHVGYNAMFSINLRADDAGILAEMKRIWKLREPLRIWDRGRDRRNGKNVGDAVILSIRDIPTLANKVIPTFEKFRMRAKKQADLDLFKRAVSLLARRRATGKRYSSFTEEEKQELESIYLALREVKKYKCTASDIMAKYPAIRVG